MSATCTCARWRRWRIADFISRHLYMSGITSSGGSWRTGGPEGHEGCHTMPGFDRHRRPYVLWVSRNTWRCWHKGHRRGEHVGWGYCGKCIPWPCCGSERVAHADGCPEDDS